MCALSSMLRHMPEKEASSMSLPNPSEREQEAITEAKTRRIARRPRVGARLLRKGEDTTAIRPDHSDATGWTSRILDALGSPSGDFACMEIDRLATALGSRDGRALVAALAVIDGQRPKDEIEAQLLIQM